MDSVPFPRFDLSLLGSFELTGPDGAVDLPSKKLAGLLAYLALGLFAQTLRLPHEQFFQSGILETKSSQHGVAPSNAGGSTIALRPCLHRARLLSKFGHRWSGSACGLLNQLWIKDFGSAGSG